MAIPCDIYFNIQLNTMNLVRLTSRNGDFENVLLFNSEKKKKKLIRILFSQFLFCFVYGNGRSVNVKELSFPFFFWGKQKKNHVFIQKQTSDELFSMECFTRNELAN